MIPEHILFVKNINNLNALSVNKAWRGGPRYRTADYKSYEEVIWAHIGRQSKAFDGPVQVDLAFHFKYAGKRDVDNPIKPILDILVKLNYLKDDTQVQRLVVSKCHALEDSIYIAIKKLDSNESHFCSKV